MRKFFNLESPLPPVVLPVFLGLIALAAARTPVQAQEPAQENAIAAPRTKTYFIAGGDGYGIEDCFKNGAACGQIVASSWCEGRGHGKPAAWGSADDLTASIAGERKAHPRGTLVITCNE